MTTWCDQRFSVDGVELAWGERGSGRPLVLVHGWTGSAHDFTLHIDELSKHRHVFALDHRGHGDSTNTGVADSYTIARLAADLEAWAEAVIGEPFDLLGHSMGGRVVIDFALKRADLVNSLILMDTTAWRMNIDLPVEEWLAKMSDADICSYLTTEANNPEDIAIRAAVPSQWLDDNMGGKRAVDPIAARQLGFEIFATDPPNAERLAEIACPVTVIVGELDHPFIDHAPALTAGVANGLLTVIPGAWHSPQLTHPTKWLAAVNQHLIRA
jgi:pimeloyl-ACP methyl ester carboxylesterase